MILETSLMLDGQDAMLETLTRVPEFALAVGVMFVGALEVGTYAATPLEEGMPRVHPERDRKEPPPKAMPEDGPETDSVVLRRLDERWNRILSEEDFTPVECF